MKKSLMIILALVMAFTLVMGSVSTVSAKGKTTPTISVSIDVNQVYGYNANSSLNNSIWVNYSYAGYHGVSYKTITILDPYEEVIYSVKITDRDSSEGIRLMGGDITPVIGTYITTLTLWGAHGKKLIQIQKAVNTQTVSTIQ